MRPQHPAPGAGPNRPEGAVHVQENCLRTSTGAPWVGDWVGGWSWVGSAAHRHFVLVIAVPFAFACTCLAMGRACRSLPEAPFPPFRSAAAPQAQLMLWTFRSRGASPGCLSQRLTPSFADLVHRLGHPPKHVREPTADGEGRTVLPDEIFASWLNHLPRPFAPHTGKHLFRLLFPHEGNRRRYGMKETRLAAELETILGIRNLRHWDSVAWDRGRGGTGCLGDEVEFAMGTRVGRGTAGRPADGPSCQLKPDPRSRSAKSTPFSMNSRRHLPSPSYRLFLPNTNRPSRSCNNCTGMGASPPMPCLF